MTFLKDLFEIKREKEIALSLRLFDYFDEEQFSGVLRLFKEGEMTTRFSVRRERDWDHVEISGVSRDWDIRNKEGLLIFINERLREYKEHVEKFLKELERRHEE